MGCKPETHSAESGPIGLRPCWGVRLWSPASLPAGNHLGSCGHSAKAGQAMQLLWAESVL